MSVHARRRQKLLDTLGDGLLVLPTAAHKLRNGDVHYSFRPGSDFTYLTGFPEPHAVLVAWRTGTGKHRSILFVMPRDKAREIWDGKRHGVRGAVQRFGVDEAFPIESLREKLPDLLAPHIRLFHTLGDDEELDDTLMKVFAVLRAKNRRRNPAAHPILEDPKPTIAKQRLVKDAEELATMRQAADISAEAHCAAMRAARPGMTEYQVQAVIEETFRTHGSMRNGYDSIVASGPNACILHYIENTRKMRRGDLLLVDAGAEVDSYTADITRTWPISGAFSDAQKAIYSIVLKAEKACVRVVQPGKAWDGIHKTALREITKGLVSIGLLKGDVAKLVKKGACRKWFMHGTSHWLGMDVHDVGPYEDADGKSIKLRPGMAMTVEPGLYFDPADKSVPKEFRGIGVRIEDDVVVTRTGHEVLTGGVPKEVREVEALCAAGA